MEIKNENNLRFSVFILGMTSMIAQIILLRDFLNVFSGNELVVGIILANWMLLTALGAYIGQYARLIRNKPAFVFISHLLLGMLPLFTAMAVFYQKAIIFPPGIQVSLINIYLISIVILLPLCLVSGVMFTFFSAQLSTIQYSNAIYRVYALEAIGAIFGGFIFNFVLIFLFNSFFSLKIVMLINLLAALFLSYSSSKNLLSKITAFAALALAGYLLTLDINHKAIQSQYKNQQVVDESNSPYGNLVVTKTSGQYNFYENGVPLFSTDNPIQNEESIHYAMLQHPDPENVLLISGGVAGTINEILKYNIKSLDYVEINPELVRLGNKYIKNIFNNKKVHVFNEDPRLFLKSYNKIYDVVIVNLPDPTNTHLNRFYTLEFFEEVKNNLSGKGVFCTSLSSSANYLSEEAKQLHTALYSTLKLIFDNVIIIPGMRNYFLASDGSLSANITKLTKSKNITNQYVNPFYLDDELIEQRSAAIENEINENIIINYDFYPVTYFLQLELWVKQFKFNGIIVAIILSLIIVLILPRLHIINLGLFTTGFSASSLEILLIIAFQVIYGYVYFMIGIFITVFMIGLVTGSLYLYKRLNISYKNFSLVQYVMGIFAIIAPVALTSIKSNPPLNIIIHSVFIFFILITGLITGVQFSLGTSLRLETIPKTASSAYGADLLGSSLGALLVASLLIPLLGIIKVCLILGILNFITGLVILIIKRKS